MKRYLDNKAYCRFFNSVEPLPCFLNALLCQEQKLHDSSEGASAKSDSQAKPRAQTRTGNRVVKAIAGHNDNQQNLVPEHGRGSGAKNGPEEASLQVAARLTDVGSALPSKGRPFEQINQVAGQPSLKDLVCSANCFSPKCRRPFLV